MTTRFIMSENASLIENTFSSGLDHLTEALINPLTGKNKTGSSHVQSLQSGFGSTHHVPQPEIPIVWMRAKTH